MAANTCPEELVNDFARIPDTTFIENEFYGAYNKLLYKYCFQSEGWTVIPQYALPNPMSGPGAPLTIDAPFIVQLDKLRLPVFFIEIRPPNNRDTIPTRIAADALMRDRFKDLFDLSPFPTIYGVSAMGKYVAFYSMDKATGVVIPELVPSSPKFIKDTVPKERWSTDISTAAGYAAFMEVVGKVKTMVQGL